MARLITPNLSLGTSALIGALAVLSGCSGSEPSTSQGERAGGVGKIIYAVRQHTVVEGGQVKEINVAGGMGQVMDYGRYVPGGRLEIFDLRSGKTENVIEDYPTADISSVDLSFDATKVLFTMKKDGSDYYHVYWAGMERGDDGKFPITQLTFQPSDDQQAIWAAGD
ncbi:MAG TPA: hypothetical protein VEQ58_17955, partial [Polyangiaceae bacterium]|nr:hypothetical protein [Polyangiaceae bacterium]